MFQTQMAIFLKLLLLLYLCLGGLCCNSGWYNLEGKCYKGTRKMYSVTVAKRYCQVLGGQLAYVNSTSILQYLGKIPGFGSGNGYWVSDDSTLAENTTEVHSAEMSTVCRYATKLTINTEDCEKKKYFVCETRYPDEPDICPEDFDHYGSHCYRAVRAAPLNYMQANSYCVRIKSKLATLETKDEEWETEALLLGTREMFLVGARKKNGVIKWSNGFSFSPVNYKFSNYSEGECVGLFSPADDPFAFSWALVRCDRLNSFLCETDLSTTPTTPTTTVAPSTTTLAPLTCPPGEYWKLHEDSGYCFRARMYGENLNWFQAREFCQAYGGDLASYDNAEQEMFALGNAARNYYGLWIGLKRDENDVFHWVNGTTLSYTNWDDDEPNLSSRSKFCVTYAGESSRSGSRSKWKLDYCGVQRAFVCRAPKMRVTTIPEYKGETNIKCNITGTSEYSSDWYRYQDHCYLFQDEARYTWDTARIFCQENGGHLASIHSFEETDFILSKIDFSFPFESNFWIGLSANGLESSFDWTDNTPLDLTYWSENKQDHRNFSFCVDFHNRDGSWNFNHCSRNQRVICKRGINLTYDFTTEPATIMPGNCETGWYSLGNKCYKFFGTLMSQRVSWVTANKECNKINASLVSIHSKDEQEYLTEVMLKVDDDVWIGMRNTEIGNTYKRTTLFQWSDGTNVNFTNWKKGEPDFSWVFDFPMYSLENPNLCVVMENSRHFGKWNDILCSAKHSYICQKMKDPTNVKPYEDPFACALIKGWYKLGSMCYGPFDQQKMTWMEAQRECQKYNADLITIKSAAVNFFIMRKLEIINMSSPYFWIGVREKEPNNYQLVSHQPFLYDNWMAGQPKNACSYLDNCVAMQREGEWIVRSCKEAHNFICGLAIAESSNEPEVVIDKENMCANLTGYWQDFGGANCYMHANDLKFSWVDAMNYCSTRGGYLASFHSGEEIEKLAKYMASLHTFYIPSIHIGFREIEDGLYGWVDNSTVDFTNWDVRQPPAAACEKRCVVMNFRNQKWRTIDCAEHNIKRGFVCSAPKRPAKEVPRTMESG